MTFIDIANSIDEVRTKSDKKPSIILWENVEGVLNDRTNAFGNFVAGLAGFDEEIKVSKWMKSGLLLGPKRNVAWRVIDAKHFGLAQQRKRLYVVAGGKDVQPDRLLFEISNQDPNNSSSINEASGSTSSWTLFDDGIQNDSETNPLVVFKNGIQYQFFRKYTDCLYSAYGTKWNGNAAAYNGSLYVSQNDRLRRFTPLECERLMGFPDDYTLVNGNSDTSRFQAIGNSWAVPVIEWIGQRIANHLCLTDDHSLEWKRLVRPSRNNLNAELYLFDGVIRLGDQLYMNASAIPNSPQEGSLETVIQSEDVPDKFFLSPQACRGILRRKDERDLKMNKELEQLMSRIGDVVEIECA